MFLTHKSQLQISVSPFLPLGVLCSEAENEQNCYFPIPCLDGTNAFPSSTPTHSQTNAFLDRITASATFPCKQFFRILLIGHNSIKKLCTSIFHKYVDRNLRMWQQGKNITNSFNLKIKTLWFIWLKNNNIHGNLGFTLKGLSATGTI